MKLYSSIGPNPRLVRMFLAEKGVELPVEQVDIMAGVNRQPAFLALNPLGTTPVLEVDGGLCIAETTAICEYLEERFPTPRLIGSTLAERAETRMWWRRVDQAVVQPLTAGFRAAEGYGMFKDRVRCYPSAADEFKAAAREGLIWLDGQIGSGPFICGERLTVVDLLLVCFVEFGALVGQPLDSEACPGLARWLDGMNTRQSVAETR
ncbi:glutathione S-transferase family protein [Stutzerimonas tarimensis]|uniref:Glutathione S-transferase family protein n=1 Tax=Stutzerimonas tarimensis TaxID=1507735 RepID=A0ABV7T7E5_9GAMM